MTAGGDELTIYVGHAGEKYSDPDDWRELIAEGRLAPDSLVPVRRAGALQHVRAFDLPELKPLFHASGFAPDAPTPPAPARAPRREPGAKRARPPSTPSAKTAPPPEPTPEPPRMVQEMVKGANAAVATGGVFVRLVWSTPPSGAEIDGCAFLLTAAGRVRSDADMIFYNQPSAEADAVRMLLSGPTSTVFHVELARLPTDLARVVFCAAVTQGGAGEASFGRLRPAIEAGPTADQPILRHHLDLEDGREAAIIFGELYRRGEGWRFRAVSQGFHGGLAPLARAYGVVVQD